MGPVGPWVPRVVKVKLKSGDGKQKFESVIVCDRKMLVCSLHWLSDIFNVSLRI